MLDVMTQAKNAIEAYNTALKISSSNLANMNVPGYKKLNVSFQSVFEQVLTQGTAAGLTQGGTNPKQLGQGMSIAGTSIDFANGETTSGSAIDLAIAGGGLFIVSPDGGASQLYTRNGNFEVDAAGNLTSNGMQVYGFDSSGNLVPIVGLPSGQKTDYKWQDDGTLLYSPDSGTTFTTTGYRIALTHFANPGGLVQAQGTAFAATLASGNAASAESPGGVAGIIKPGQVEQSNVNYLSESIYSLELQRALSGNLSMVRLASDLISSVITKLT
ncbi:MAG: flagellar hook basal-body protein [Candidatus Margulisiibacteriota bacterium]